MTTKHKNGFYDIYIKEPAVDKNSFRKKAIAQTPVPAFDSIKTSLPQPIWDNHPDAINCWWKAWKIAFANIKPANTASHFVSPFIDSAFNECLFMWDSVFIMQFAKYGLRAFDFFQTLDNFYCRQHDDGFICREIKEWDGTDRFHRFDPASTGPNILAFAEWEQYQFTGDKERLTAAFYALLGYHRWMRKYRTWPDGSYWTSGWACGMDNQPRTANPAEWTYHHDHQTWIDATLQALLSAQTILKIAREINIDKKELSDIVNEKHTLSEFVNNTLWDPGDCFFKDKTRNGFFSDVKTIGAFWCLHADSIPDSHIASIIQHLDNPAYFCRHHRIPSLSADNQHFNPHGGYWQGSVWPPTNYMVISGLYKHEFHELARAIALNHYNVVLDVFKETGTFWENYAPDFSLPGNKAKRDFVGWSGLAPIALLIEYVIGIHASPLTNQLKWDISLTDRHGITNYPFGNTGTISLECKERVSTLERPVVTITSDIPVSVEIHWPAGTYSVHITKENLC